MTRYFFTSVTRISPLPDLPFTVEPLPREFWAAGDYVVGEVAARPNPSMRVKALNLLSRESLWELREMLRKARDLRVDNG